MTRHPAQAAEPGRFLTSAEVAALFRVSVNTANRWARQGRLPAFRTPGGQWRFLEPAVRAALPLHRQESAR